MSCRLSWPKCFTAKQHRESTAGYVIAHWALEGKLALSAPARDAIIDGNNIVFVSAVSVWEISIKKALGKLQAPDTLLAEIERLRFTPLDVTLEHADRAGRLPPLHTDPFDRMLIAQAQSDHLMLVTRDSEI